MPSPPNPLDKDPRTDIHTPLGAAALWRVLAITLLIVLDGWWRLFALLPTILELAALASLPARMWRRGYRGGYP